jgi:hypothetical protein
MSYTSRGLNKESNTRVLVRCAITRQDSNSAPAVLNSWKEIAHYLDRGVRTVQRWEHELHLPVHRIGAGKRSPVYAKVSELNFWLSTSEVARQEYGNHVVPPGPGPSLVAGQDMKPIDNARRLLSAAKDLAKRIAETSVRQRRQAEDLQARILQMRQRVK